MVDATESMKFSRLIKKIDSIIGLPRFSPEFKVWRSEVNRTISRIWGKDSEYYTQFDNIKYTLGISGSFTPQVEYDKRFRQGLREAKLLLESFRPEIPTSSSSEEVKEDIESMNKKDVFIVHGHDEETLLRVKDFVGTLGLNPIILHEKPDEGFTVVEKFEKHSSVSFAIILLTPDDVGFPKGKEDQKRGRARQNVILEMGFFLGKLGRKGVRALYKEDVEIPSDYGSVLFIKLEEDDWKLKLAREMKVAGLEIDLNKLAG